MMIPPKSLNVSHTLHDENRWKNEEESTADDMIDYHVDKSEDSKTSDEYTTIRQSLRWQVSENLDYFCYSAWFFDLIAQLFIHFAR